MKRAMAMALKELMHIQRDPQLLGFALAMPVVLIILFGYGVSFDIDRVPLAIVDHDRTTESRELVDAFTASAAFETVATPQDADATDPLMQRNVAKATLVIPEGHARSLARGETSTAQLIVDGSDNQVAAVALGYASAVGLDASRKRLADVAPAPLMEARVRTLFNPSLDSTIFLMPGLMVVVLVLVAVMLTALTVAREYERGSMEQLFATPVSRLDIILGKLGPYFVLGMLQVLLVLVLGVSLFGVPLRGNLLLLMAASALFLLAMLMQGLVISVIARNQVLASQLAAISTMLPSMLLSGFIFPIDGMPAPLQAIAHVLPATHLVDALRGIMLRGNGLAEIWPALLALAAYFVVMLAVSVKRFQRRVA